MANEIRVKEDKTKKAKTTDVKEIQNQQNQDNKDYTKAANTWKQNETREIWNKDEKEPETNINEAN